MTIRHEARPESWSGVATLLLALVCVACVIHDHQAYAGSIEIVRTNQTGANGQLDVNHEYTWNFSNSGSTTFDQITASFVLKRNNSAAAPARLQLFQTNSGFFPLGSALYTSELAVADGSNQYTTEVFNLFSGAPPVSLPPYFALRLSSETPDNKQWFIKAPETSVFLFQDENGNTIDGFTFAGSGNLSISGSGAGMPEPSSLALGALFGLGGLARARFNRRRKTREPEGSQAAVDA